MKETTWQAVNDMFTKAPIMKSEPVDLAEILAAEAVIGVKLSSDYKEFVARYGGAIVGPFRIYGLRKAEPMGNNEESFVEITKHFRRQGWPGVEHWAIVSMDHSGNPVGLDPAGKVWISDHDTRTVQLLAEDFERYLTMYCLKLEE